jgi:AcrR family transcriptional regulator
MAPKDRIIPRESAVARRAADTSARERLLESATASFTAKGYAAATVREIVDAAGVTKPVLYYYFRNKEGLFLELMGNARGMFDALVDSSLERPGTAKERIRRLATDMIELFLRHIELARLIYSIYYGPPQGAPQFDFDAFHHRFREVVKEMVLEGVRNGEFRKTGAQEMMWAVLGAINVTMEVRLCHPEVVLGRKELDGMLDILFEGMKPGRRAGKGGRG